MAVYSALHTGPKTAFGGVQDGFLSFVYLDRRSVLSFECLSDCA